MLLSRGKKSEVTHQLTPSSAAKIARWIGCYGVVWNLKVTEDKQATEQWFANGRASEGRPKPNQSAAHFVDDIRPWLGEVPSQIRRNAAAKWFEAKNAALKGLRKSPRLRRPFGKKSCVVTAELFEARISEGKLFLGFKSSAASAPFCFLSVEAGQWQREAPRSLVVSRVGSRFFVSWSYEFEAAIEEESVLSERLAMSPASAQEAAVLAVDVGIAQPATLSDGTVYDFSPGAKRSFRRLDVRKRKYQKRMARAKSGSNNRRKLRAKSARVQAKARRIRKDFLHKTAKAIADKAGAVVVLEDLRITNMVRRPKAKPILDAQGTVVRYEKNRAAQKAGLNAAILAVGWGELRTLLSYKLRERNKFLVVVPAHHSSQECSKCRFTDAGNRLTQASFACLACGHAENADTNAAKVLKNRFLTEFRKGTLLPKSKATQKISVRRKPRGSPPQEARCEPVEPDVRPGSDSRQGLRSRKSPSARKACSGPKERERARPESRSSFL